jgi:hypothetical protein
LGGLPTDRCKKREGRGQLTGKVMDSKVRAVRTQRFGSNGQIDGLEERVSAAERVCDRDEAGARSLNTEVQ